MSEVLSVLLTSDPRYVEELKSELNSKLTGNISSQELSAGLLLLDRLEGNESVSSALVSNPPFFLRHLFPVSSVVALSGAHEPEAIARGCARIVPSPRTNGAKVSVQCRLLGEGREYRAVDVKRAIDAVLTAKGYAPEIRHPDYIVSVVVAPNKAYCGWSTPAQNLSRWNGGAVHYGQAANSFSRARHKLEEAVEALEINLNVVHKALDLGAAPGGWSSFLLSRGITVTAVDTGELEESLLKEPRLTFLKQNAFELRLPQNSFDLITCDMSWDPLRTSSLLLRLSPMLRPGGSLVMTVKFMGYRPLPLVAEVTNKLARVFTLVRGRHLWHNREELTLYLTKAREGEKSGGNGASNTKGSRGANPAFRRGSKGRRHHASSPSDQGPVYTP